jgi:hypothetical protein
VEGTCPRCGGATGESRWCATCGKDLTGRPSLPTPEAAEAARREAAWLDAHADVAAAESRAAEEAARERAHAPPPGAPPGFQQPPQAHMHEAMRADPPSDPSGLARAVRWLLYAQIVAAVVTGILEAVYLGVLGDLSDDEWFASAKLEDAASAVDLAYIVQTLLLLVTAGFFIAWLHRVYKNVRGLGAGDLRHGTGWAIGGWFVPILWWWRPKEIVNDTWRASDPALGMYAGRGEWADAPVPAVITAWWASWLIWGLVNRIANRMWTRADSLDVDRTATILALCTEPIMILAAVLAIRTVSMVTGRQAERAAARERMGPQPVAAPQV